MYLYLYLKLRLLDLEKSTLKTKLKLIRQLRCICICICIWSWGSLTWRNQLWRQSWSWGNNRGAGGAADAHVWRLRQPGTSFAIQILLQLERAHMIMISSQTKYGGLKTPEYPRARSSPNEKYLKAVMMTWTPQKPQRPEKRKWLWASLDMLHM